MSESAATTIRLPAGFGTAPTTPALLDESRRVQDAFIGPLLDAVLRDQVPHVSCERFAWITSEVSLLVRTRGGAFSFSPHNLDTHLWHFWEFMLKYVAFLELFVTGQCRCEE